MLQPLKSKKQGAVINTKEVRINVTEHMVYQDGEYNQISHVTESLIALNSD